MKLTNLTLLNITVFLKSQSYLLPVMLLFYIQNGLDAADFFFFQGLVGVAELLLGLPCGYIGDYFSKKTILLFSYLMLFMRYALWLFFGGYWIILIGELCYALYKSLFQSTAEGYIYQYLCENKQEKDNLNKYSLFNAAASIGSAVSSLLGALIFKEIGLKIVLLVQLAVVISGIILLCFIKPVRKENYKEKRAYKTFNLFLRLCILLKNSNLKYFIIISGMFTAVTSLLLHTFQPLMHLGNVPVLFFGGIYFINHITRALVGGHTDKILQYIDMKKLGFICYVVNMLSFVFMYVVIKYNMFVAIMPLLIFVCIGIAIQLSFNVGVVSNLQEHTELGNRSMMASFNNTFMRLVSSLILLANTVIVKNFGLMYEPVLGILFIGGTILFLPYLSNKK